MNGSEVVLLVSFDQARKSFELLFWHFSPENARHVAHFDVDIRMNVAREEPMERGEHQRRRPQRTKFDFNQINKLIFFFQRKSLWNGVNQYFITQSKALGPFFFRRWKFFKLNCGRCRPAIALKYFAYDKGKKVLVFGPDFDFRSTQEILENLIDGHIWNNVTR